MQKRFRRLLQLAVIVASSLFSPSALAQITPDGSLPTSVERSGDDFTINDGARAGDNLFHSFDNFSVPTDGSATFNNALDVVNIFNRVTGGNISQIDGLIRSNGSANLFLINPAGIIFGEGSRLDIGGSFYGGTTQSILFPDGVEFNADRAIEPILTINAPIGFNVREDAGDIVNRSVVESQPDEFGFGVPIGLSVEEGQSITLEANQIRFESGLLTAPGGSIELRALGDIAIQGNTIDFAVDTSSRIGDGGAIEINSSNGSIFISDTEVSSGAIGLGNGGQINIFAQEALVIEDTVLNSFANFSGEGGNVSLESATSIALIDTRIDTGAFGDLRSGNIRIEAFNGGTIDFIGGQDLSTIEENQDLPANIFADAIGSGEGLEGDRTGGNLTIIGGDITINSYQLILEVNGGDFNPNTSGNGGNISITGENIAIANSILQTQTEGDGAAGSITITGERLSLDNAVIEASNRPASTASEDSVGGNIDLRLERFLSLRNNSSIKAEAENNASGGNIDIDSQLIVAFPASGNGNDIIAGADTGRGGNISISTESIFNLEERVSQLNNGTNDIDASSPRGVDGNVSIDTFSLNQLESIVPLSVSLVESEQTVAYSCEAERNASGLAIKGKGGIPEPPTAPLKTENIHVEEDSNSSGESIKNNNSSDRNSSAISIETANGRIDLAMGAIVRKDGTISLVGEPNRINTLKQTGGLLNCL